MAFNTSEQPSSFKVSRYNSAANQLLRLHLLWMNANIHSRHGDYHAWNFDLDAIWRELSSDLPEGSNEEKTFIKFNTEINKLLPLASPHIKSFNKKEGIPKDTRSQQYMLLDQKDIFLRRIQNKLGKGTAYEESIEEYMD